MSDLVEAASSRGCPVPWSVLGAQLSLTSSGHGENGHQSSHALGGSQQGGVPPQPQSVRPPSGDPGACLSPQPEPASRPSRLESEQRVVERGLFRDQGERFWHESSHQPIRPHSQVVN